MISDFRSLQRFASHEDNRFRAGACGFCSFAHKDSEASLQAQIYSHSLNGYSDLTDLKNACNKISL